MSALQPLDDLVDTLRHAKINADLDPAKLRVPGVWVQVNTIDTSERMHGRTYNLTLALIVGDRETRRAIQKLLELLDQVRAVIPDHGAATARSYLLPENPTPLPGLAVPFNLRTKETS